MIPLSNLFTDTVKKYEPTYAGMIPISRMLVRFSRGEPAYAGMMPLTLVVPSGFLSEPRIRGDDPSPAEKGGSQGREPRIRGDVRPSLLVDDIAVREPPHAGMIPCLYVTDGGRTW